jgi:dTDP-4-dehydrorhamnose 3,5-epimerase
LSRFAFSGTTIDGLQIVERKPIGDARGFLCRIFCDDELSSVGWRGGVAQINHTLTGKRGTVRGMHFQRPPHAEFKLVSCIKGEVWDVAVDLRARSPTFLQWYGEHLSAENHRALLIPAGFAHGFQALSDGVELLYCHSAPYVPAAESGLTPTDPRLGISWPLPVIEVSARDSGHPLLTKQFEGMSL